MKYIDNLITGEQFQYIADIYLGLPGDFISNPNIIKQIEKCINIYNINEPFNNPSIIFCYPLRLSILQSKIKLFNNPFTLITHNSDENIDERYESLLYSNKIIKWYAQNILIKHPKLIMLPIGIANSQWPHGDLNTLKSIILENNKKTNDFYFYFSLETNMNARSICKSDLELKGLLFGSNKDYTSYLRELSTYKFAICPPGNGIDSHRIWECYYLGVIPVLLRSTFTEQIYDILPCILLDNWTEFDMYTILTNYEDMYTILDTKYLTLQHYTTEIKNIVPKIVYFISQGRDGNNIFQYLAAEVIKYMYKFDIVKNIDNIPPTLLSINDITYSQIISNYIQNPDQFLSSNTNIILDGYFQKTDILVKLRSYLLKYFNIYNHTYINNTHTIADFSRIDTSHNIQFDNDTLLLHLRLDDFVHHNSPPNIFDKKELGIFLDTISFTKLYILCDNITQEWEKKYIQYFVDKYQAIILSGSLFNDFNLLKIATRLVISPSTFSWIGAYLGNAKQVYIPYSDFYKDHQILKECHQNCIVHYGIPFAKDILLTHNFNLDYSMNLSYKTNPNTTHQPLLLEVLQNTSGNIIELGCGEGSTHLSRSFLNNNRKLYSIESKLESLLKYKYLENDNHKLFYIDAGSEDNDETGLKWTKFLDERFKDIDFEIVFIDQSPWTARIHVLKYFINKAKYIIIHDVDYFPSNNKFGKIIKIYNEGSNTKYDIDFSDIASKYYTFYPPFEHYTYHTGIPTLICSNTATDDEFNNLVNIIEKNYNKYY